LSDAKIEIVNLHRLKKIKFFTNIPMLFISFEHINPFRQNKEEKS